MREMLIDCRRAPQHDTIIEGIAYFGIEFIFLDGELASCNKLCNLGVKVFFGGVIPDYAKLRLYISDASKRPLVDGIRMRRFKKVLEGETLSLQLIDGSRTTMSFLPGDRLYDWLGEEGPCFFGAKVL
jgi:hypothetical protein